MKKRKLCKNIFVIFALLVVVIALFYLLTTNFNFIGKSSIHEDAKKYKNSSCLVFYPDSSYAKSKAKELCKSNKEDKAYDYSLVPYGNYYLISYGDDFCYFTDLNYKKVEFGELSEDARQILSDYLRVAMKESKPDDYYNIEFLENSYKDNIVLDNISFSLDKEYLLVTYSDYEVTARIPLKYAYNLMNMDFGYEKVEYSKPFYYDSTHPVICLTFDDGPCYSDNEEDFISNLIAEYIYKYDVSATFFTIGERLEQRYYINDAKAYNFLKKVISYGNEYGSHTWDHQSLIGLDSDKVVEEISSVADYFKTFIDYDIAVYRPVDGSFNDTVLNVEPYPAILWNIDSEDWLSRDKDTIVQNVLYNYNINEGDVMIFHDIYYSTYEAIQEIIPELIKRGFQIVKVTDLLDSANINIETLKYFYDTTYYE